MSQPLAPDRIFEVVFGFAAAKTLLSAVELGVFDTLAKGPKDVDGVTKELGLNGRGAADFLDTLVALRMIDRDAQGRYQNTAESAAFLARNSPSYIGGMIEMANNRLYGFWGNLTEALKTGKPQNEAKHDPDVFKKLYSDPERLARFLGAMTGLSTGSGKAISAKFDWRPYRTFVDVGTAEGALAVQVALAHGHLSGGGADLPQVRPLFEKNVRRHGLDKRLAFAECDFFTQELPRADVIVMGHILHDWGLETKQMLLAKAYRALPSGGAIIVHDAMIDDERRRNVAGLLMSLNMLIETHDGFDYTPAQLRGWMREAGFKDVRIEPLSGVDWMGVAFK
jgi:precorrin-6B methylase 2